MPRQLEPINQLIPQMLPIRARTLHSHQYLRLTCPQRSVVHRWGPRCLGTPLPERSVEYGKIEYGGLPVKSCVFNCGPTSLG